MTRRFALALVAVLVGLLLMLVPLVALAADAVPLGSDPAAAAWVSIGQYLVGGGLTVGGAGIFSYGGWYLVKTLVKGIAQDVIEASAKTGHDMLVNVVKECGPELRAALVEMMREAPPIRVQLVADGGEQAPTGPSLVVAR